jgi:hypothetical protein
MSLCRAARCGSSTLMPLKIADLRSSQSVTIGVSGRLPRSERLDSRDFQTSLLWRDQSGLNGHFSVVSGATLNILQ